MFTCHTVFGRVVTLAAALLIVCAHSSLLAQELESTYSSSYNTQGPTPSRWETEQAIWNADGWPGSERAIPTYAEDSSLNDERTAYQVVPEFILKDLGENGLLYRGHQGTIEVNCGHCPLEDQFEIPRCDASEVEFCASEGDVKAAISDYYNNNPNACSYQFGQESSWANPNDGDAGELENGTALYYVSVTKTVHVEWEERATWPLYSTCDDPTTTRHWDWLVHSTSFKSCETGYYDVGTLSPQGPSCSNHFFAWLYEYPGTGVEPAESAPEQSSCGNPCHPKTGNKSLSETDFSSPTLELTRSWNAMAKYQDYAAMGRGWTYNYSQRLMSKNGASIPTMKLLDGIGSVEYFVCTDDPTCSLYRSTKTAGWLLRPDGGGGWEMLAPSGERRLFDQWGRLLQIERRSGDYSLVTVTYANGKIDQVTDQLGRSLTFNYNPDGLVDSVTLPSGGNILYDYNQPVSIPAHVTWQQQLVKVTREDLTERIYHYEDQYPDTSPRFEFLVTGITDENNIRYATYAYDDHGRAISSEHAGGAGLIALNYTHRPGESENWTITEVTMPLGEVSTYEMNPDPFRKLTGLTDTRGTVSLNYDPTTTWRTDRTDREGNQTSYEYTDGLHETRRTEAVGTADERVIETDWGNVINRVLERREPGKTTSYTYNARGQVLTRTETDTATLDTRTWTYTYYEVPSIAELIGRLETVDGPRTDVADLTTYAYYTSDDPGGNYLKGDLHTITNALGHVTEYLEYDGNGRPLQVKDANNVVIIMTYHARGWIESRTTDGQTTSFYYDNVGNLTRVTQPDGSFSEYEYDDAHRLEAIADNFDNRIEYTLDAAGNRTAENTYNDLGVLRRQMSRVYDQLSRLQKIIDGNLDETLYGYDNNGNRTSSQDPNLNTTSFEYDPLDRLVKTIDATLGETLMGYDDRDNLTTVTDPLGNVTAYSYDGLDNQTQIDSPDTGITTYEYDTAGNRTAATDARGVRVEYSYDALNRLTFVDYPDNSLDVTFTYDVGTNGKGRLTSMDDAAGTETYTYDARGNLISVDRGFVILNYTTYYEYNGADRLTKITYPSGMVIDYTLDAAGRVTAVDKTYSGSTDNLVTNVVYEPFGPVSDFTFGNGLTMSASFDQDYELDDLQSGSSLDWVFGYDDVGNILTIDDQLAPANDQTFTYDDLYRLDTALGIYGTEDFDYDANGNRTRYQNGLVDDPYTYEPLSNRLATQDGWTFNRDAAGNRLDRLNGLGYGQLYAYGDHNRLAQVTDRDGAGDMVVGTYTYDGRGQRVARTAGGVTTHFIYGLNGELLGEYADDATPESEYVFLNGQPIAMLATEVTVPTPNEVIIDNDASDTSSTGSWVSRNSQEAVNGSHREGDGIETYRWTPALSAGTYEVYAWWVAKNNYSDSVDYTIAHDGGTSIENRSHKSGGGQWQLLGNYNFDGVGTEYVEVSAANGKTSADAIRWLEVVGGPVETISTFFIHTDHLGTPRRVTDDTQTVIWRWDSSPFGDSVPDEDPDGDSNDFVLNLRFPGQYYDAESGLHYNYYRDYDPSTGRYIESDPIGLLGGLNTFQFSLNHPLSLIDRFGLQTTYPNEFCITDSAGIIHCWPIPTPPVQPVPKQQSACDKIMADSCSKSSCKNCCTEFNDREDWRHMTFFRMLDDCADPSSAQPQGPGCMWPHVATDLINARANRAWLERCLRECGAH